MSFFFKKNKYFNVVIVGAGKLAYHLAPALEDSGHQISAVYSRSPRQAEVICELLYAAEPVHNLNFSESNAQVFVLAVADDAIEKVSSEINLPKNALLLHTSGGKSLQALSGADVSCGVLYPLQTFSPEKTINFKEVPFLIEADSDTGLKKVRQIAESLSEHVDEVDSRSRQILHAAAVFACNFSNHMLHLAEEMIVQEGLEFELLKPLIEETYTKALQILPSKSQTGPAIRNDVSTMKGHIKLLKKRNPALADLYQRLSHSIQENNQL